jgi:hypothetical protein
VLNAVAHHRAMPPRLVGPWTRHHIEEIGNLPHFLPDLFREQAGTEPEEAGRASDAATNPLSREGDRAAVVIRDQSAWPP